MRYICNQDLTSCNVDLTESRIMNKILSKSELFVLCKQKYVSGSGPHLNVDLYVVISEVLSFCSKTVAHSLFQVSAIS